MVEGPDRPLDKEEAEFRSQVLSSIKYRLFLDLTHSAEFSGKLTVEFTHNGARPEPVWLDVANLLIKECSLSVDKEQNRLYLQGVRPGANLCTVTFQGYFSRTGTGLHRFRDPADSCTYIYSYLCPFFARSVFPCFDQPDLKASLKLTLRVPSTWQTFSNVNPSQETEESNVGIGSFKQIAFAETPPLSTYLMAVVAGDFELIEDTGFRVPLTIAYRKSMAGFVPCQEILSYTRKGIEYYEGLFGVPMPFGKYTQVLVPEMYMGAMENAACVTINDNNLWKERPSRNEKNYFYNTILHELSHMWFGDLVTFTWWEDIWLNESFATYLSYQAQAEALQEDVWPSFFFYSTRGYNSDIMSTTHPVHIEIKNTDEAQSSFDAITYSKGAALIKALIGVMGKTDFFRAMKDYFTRFKWRNVTMQDLFGVLQDYSNIDLSKWREDWISTPGVNQLTQVFDPQLGLQMMQAAFPRGSQVLRSHTVTLTCYRDHQFAFNYARRELIPAKESMLLPDYAKTAQFVFLNLDANCYVLTSYSQDQFSTLRSLSQCPLSDALGRSVLWTSLWYMVQTGSLSPVDYLRLAQVWIQSEVNEDVADYVFTSVQKCVFDYIPTPEIERFATDFQITMTDLLTTGPADLVPLYHKRIISFAYGLSAILAMDEIMKRRSFSRTQKWHFLMIKSGFLNLAEVREMLEEELQYDGDTDMVRRLRYYCEASAYDNKASTWYRILYDRTDYSLPELELLMQGFNRQSQGEILCEFRPKVLDLLQDLIDRDEREVLESYIEEMMPHYDPPREVITSLAQITVEKTWVRQLIQKTIGQLEIRASCQDRAAASLVCDANR